MQKNKYTICILLGLGLASQTIGGEMDTRITQTFTQVQNYKGRLVLLALASLYLGHHGYRMSCCYAIRKKAETLHNTYYPVVAGGKTITLGVHGLYGGKEQKLLCMHHEIENPTGFVLEGHHVESFDFDDSCNDFCTAYVQAMRTPALRSSIAQCGTSALFKSIQPSETDKKRFKQTNVGQEKDIAKLEQEIAKYTDEYPNIILGGVSRGAATILNYAGSCKTPENIKALVLEAPFDDPRSVINHLLMQKKMHRVPLSTTIFNAILRAFHRNYNSVGIRPSYVVEFIAKEMPILLACSLSDTMVPAQSTMKLYQKLRETGHENVYLYISENSYHGRILFGSDGIKYRNIIHAFYKKYQLPHCEQWAQEGQADFEQCQPATHALALQHNLSSNITSYDVYI